MDRAQDIGKGDSTMAEAAARLHAHHHSAVTT